MLTQIKKTNYINEQKHKPFKEKGFIIQTETTYNPKTNRYEYETKKTPAKDDYFPNTDYMDNELSQIIAAGIDPGNNISSIKPSPLKIGDTVNEALQIISIEQDTPIINDQN